MMTTSGQSVFVRMNSRTDAPVKLAAASTMTNAMPNATTQDMGSIAKWSVFPFVFRGSIFMPNKWRSIPRAAQYTTLRRGEGAKQAQWRRDRCVSFHQ
jgi:hypothetical protein